MIDGGFANPHGASWASYTNRNTQMKKVFSELSSDELRGLEVALKKVDNRAAALIDPK